MSDFAPRFAASLVVFYAADGVMNGASPNGGEMGDDANQRAMNNLLEAPVSGQNVGEQNAGGQSVGDGFVDFYAMLNQPADAPTIQLRSRINEMYAEAQANRDHRNSNRRRQYATLLHWIPQARSVLLHEGKRAKYDAYSIQARKGTTDVEFRAYLDELIGEIDNLSEGESILGVREIARPEVRLSTRLDAVRAAAGEAVKAAADSSFAASLDEASYTSNASQIASNFDSAPTRAANAERPSDSQEPLSGTANTPQHGSVTERSLGSRRLAPRASRYELGPTLQRERASLFSSAIGVITLFVVLLAARVALSSVALPVLCGIAVVVGFVVWRAVRHQLLRSIDAKLTK